MDASRKLTPAENIAPQLLEWFDVHGRHDLPWQGERQPYYVWLSEIMLQQTQVTTVIPYFQRFIERFPDIKSLAQAPLDDVLALWAGLGYYTRARNLHKAALLMAEKHQNAFPSKFDDALQLPGIGRSTAGAILAQSMGQRHPILDGNVKRVLTRLYAIPGWPGSAPIEKELWKLADKLTPEHRVVDYTQAIMDLGATVCTRSKPRCQNCPLSTQCLAYHQDTVANFPTRRPKKTTPVRTTNMVILVNESGELLFYKRPPTGIWGGLWSFPETSEQETLSQWCEREYGHTIQRQHTLSTFRHTFSHFHLDITPVIAWIKTTYQVMDQEDLAWYNVNQAKQLGIAAPVKKLLTDEAVAKINQ